MKEWVTKGIVSFAIIIVALWLERHIFPKKDAMPKVATKEILIKDSLIRDTLYYVKDSLTKEVRYIEKSYIEKKNNIIANDTTADMQFFTKYINNYTRATKDN